MGVKILIADDHQMVREGLRMLLEAKPEFEIIGESGEGRSLVQKARELKPDVVIVDITMPELDGVAATRQIHLEMPKIKIIALSMHSDRSFVHEMLRAGAAAYILKDEAFDELIAAINDVLEGKMYLSPAISQIVVQDFTRQLSTKPKAEDHPLTPRELEVLQHLVNGKSAKEIAYLLRLGVKTIETHRRQIMAKLEIDNVADLTKYAIRQGLTSV